MEIAQIFDLDELHWKVRWPDERNNMKSGLIIASGKIEDLRILKEQIHGHDYILCADGGIRYIYEINRKVDAIIGDLDSVDGQFPSFIEKNNIPIIKFPVEKDETDTELAIDHLVAHGCTHITLMGAIGTRMDHTLANILLLKRLAEKNVHGKIVNENNTIVLSNDYYKLKRKENHYVSIIPITNCGAIVSLKGFYYTLTDNLIEYGSTLGISNRLIEEEGEIFIKNGEALIIESRD